MTRIRRLTAAQVRTAPCGLHPDGDGLYLDADGAGGGSWIFRFKMAGRERWMGLGTVRHVPLAEAREKALAARKLQREGVDPLERRNAARTAARIAATANVTFDIAADRCIAAHRVGWRNARQEPQWRASLRDYVLPTFGALPVAAIDTALVTKVLEPIWVTKLQTAKRVRARIERILDWAKARGLRTGENPARWRGHLETLLADPEKAHQVRHHAALPYDRVGAFVAKLRQRDELAARALEFTILTAVRSGETLGARWSEIDLDAAVWEIPAERMKQKKPHRVPLAPRAVELLETLHSDDTSPNDFVFPGRRAGARLAPTIMQNLVVRLGHNFVVHGFRSSFRDWASDRTNFPHDVVETALAHTTDSKVAAAYKRTDHLERRRMLMRAWSEFIDAAPIEGAVVPLRAQG
jgi:integrase